MRKFFLFVLVTLFFVGKTYSQTKNKVYWVYGPEIISSFAITNNYDNEYTNVMRFAPFINVEVVGNKDFNDYFGITFGGADHNNGFIINYNDTTLKYKFRNYDIGIPVGFKVGNMKRFLFYGGYEIEFPVSFKQVKYTYDNEEVIQEWFSKRTPQVYHSIYAGFKFAPGIGFKIKYYINQFFNRDFIAPDGSTPYKNLKSNVLYFAFDFLLIKNNKFVYDSQDGFSKRGKKNKK
jgi:hypothetical protein